MCRLALRRETHLATMVYKSLNRLPTNYPKNRFRYGGAVSWNCLPTGLRQAEFLNSFKSGFKEFFQ